MWQTLIKIFKLEDLRNRIIFTILILFGIRFLAHIPIPGADLPALQEFFNRNKIFGLLNMFSGGTMESFSIVMMGVAPYINASIIMQLLTMIVPSIEALSKEGERGRQKLNQWTRWLTVPLAALQAYGMVLLLNRGQQKILADIVPFELLVIIVVITGGTIFLMWLGELISERGIGNGISLIIALGIIADLPSRIGATYAAAVAQPSLEKIVAIIFVVLVFLIVIAGIVFINEGQRNIPISYAKRVRGMRMYGGVDTFLPLRVAQAGVIPIIFALSLMLFPGVIANFFTNARTLWLADFAKFLTKALTPTSFVYMVFYFLLVLGFTYFYTAIILNPKNISENIQKQGGFIPGIRPGRQTAIYLSGIINKITLVGALFLGVIAVLPLIIDRQFPYINLVVGGTGLLIVVSVVLETARQIEAQLLMRAYEKY